eukprot:4936088-Heterocapsa_arctica.AAC.1
MSPGFVPVISVISTKSIIKIIFPSLTNLGFVSGVRKQDVVSPVLMKLICVPVVSPVLTPDSLLS